MADDSAEAPTPRAAQPQAQPKPVAAPPTPATAPPSPVADVAAAAAAPPPSSACRGGAGAGPSGAPAVAALAAAAAFTAAAAARKMRLPDGDATARGDAKAEDGAPDAEASAPQNEAGSLAAEDGDAGEDAAVDGAQLDDATAEDGTADAEGSAPQNEAGLRDGEEEGQRADGPVVANLSEAADDSEVVDDQIVDSEDSEAVDDQIVDSDDSEAADDQKIVDSADSEAADDQTLVESAESEAVDDQIFVDSADTEADDSTDADPQQELAADSAVASGGSVDSDDDEKASIAERLRAKLERFTQRPRGPPEPEPETASLVADAEQYHVDDAEAAVDVDHHPHVDDAEAVDALPPTPQDAAAEVDLDALPPTPQDAAAEVDDDAPPAPQDAAVVQPGGAQPRAKEVADTKNSFSRLAEDALVPNVHSRPANEVAAEAAEAREQGYETWADMVACEAVRTGRDSRLTDGAVERLAAVRARLGRLAAMGEGDHGDHSAALGGVSLDAYVDALQASGQRLFHSYYMHEAHGSAGRAAFLHSLSRTARLVGEVSMSVGEGGFSDVFWCESPEVAWPGWKGRAVLKCCEYGYEGLGMAFAEVEASALDMLPPHRGVVSMAACHLDFDEQMAYLVLGNAGESLYNLREEYDMSPTQIRRLLQQLLEALAFIHARGVVHRDLKPANVVINAEGTAVLIDFGTARSPAIGDLLEDPRMYGTPGFQAPELLFGDADQHDLEAYAKVDVFSLGCVAYYLVCAQDIFCDIGTYERGTWACRLDPRIADVVESCDPDMVTPLDCIMNMARFSDYELSPERAEAFTEEWLMDAPKHPVETLREHLEVNMRGFPAELIDVVEALLCPDPAARPTAAEALEMPFFKEGRDEDDALYKRVVAKAL